MRAFGARAGRWVGRALSALGLLAFVFLAVGPHSGRYRTLTVLSASMRPTFEPGAVVVVVPQPIREVAVGDVITYAIPVEDRRVVTHRVIEVLEPGVVRTKGDANNTPDPWVARLQGSAAWTVRADIPGAGHVINAMRHPVARALSILTSLAVMTWVGLRRIWRPLDHA